MTSSRCCCDQKATCCEVAGARWANRYCLELAQSTIFSNYCDCNPCPQGCDDCNTAGDYCCREFEFDWCVRGPIFRYPPGINEDTCTPEELTSHYDLCPSPWTAPNWDLTERGHTSDYRSSNSQGESGQTCVVCTAAGANNRVQYRCSFRLETVAGNECTFFDDPQTLDCEDFNEAYTVEGYASIICITAGNDGGCSQNAAYTHRLRIAPCGSAPTGLPTPPVLEYVANLSKNVAPQDSSVWVLDLVTFSYVTPDTCTGVSLPISPEYAWCTNGTPCSSYTAPCSDNQQQGCDGCGGTELSVGTLSVLTSYPCQDNPCTVS